MCKVIKFPLERIFYFGSMDDLPDIARTPEFERDFDDALKYDNPKPEPRLKLVVKEKL